jgi:short subunit dehydrogenase-like uncharacterized protein
MLSNKVLVYGASGYTGRLITALSKEFGFETILGGRNEQVIKALAQEHQLSYRIFELNNREAISNVISDLAAVLHVAGPFRYTAQPMIEACVQSKVHYIDITGEIEVFEMAKLYDLPAKEAGIMVLPGAGFDVVPTDCLALHLKNRLPDATRLNLAFANLGGGLSHGTAMTMAESLGEGGAVREAGRIVKKPLGHKGRYIDFGPKKLFAMSIPWGDVSTAFHTTNIPEIVVYTGISKNVFRLLSFQWLFNPLLKTSVVRNFFKKQIGRRPAGPTPEQRMNSKSLVWGEVINAKGESKISRLVTPDGYTLTAYSSLIIAEKIINGNFVIGYQTPASVYGPDLVMEIPGVKREDVSN